MPPRPDEWPTTALRKDIGAQSSNKPAGIEVGSSRIQQVALWIFYALLVLMGAQILLCDFLPIFDLPQHYSIAAILSSFNDPDMGWGEDFRIRTDFIPYVFIYYFAAYVGKIIGVKLAMKLLLAYCLLGFPLAIRWLLKLYQRPAWLALLALPLAYHFSYSMGFIASCVTINTTLICAGFTYRHLQRFGVAYFAIAAVCGFIVATSHALGVVTFIPIIAAIILFGPSTISLGKRALSLTVLLVPVGILAYYVFAPQKASAGLGGWQLLVKVFSSLSSPQKNIAALKSRFLNQFHDGTDQVILIVLLATLLIYLIQALWRRSKTTQPIDWSLRIIVPGLALLYFLIPFTAKPGTTLHLGIQYSNTAPASRIPPAGLALRNEGDDSHRADNFRGVDCRLLRRKNRDSYVPV